MKARLILFAAVLAGCTVPLPPSRPNQAPPPPKLENEPAPLAETGSRPSAPVAIPAPPRPPEPSPVQSDAPKAPPKSAVPPKAAAVAPAPPPKQVASAPAAPPPPSRPPLDLHSLEQRLRDTSAIGVLTKLSLKNQVDDLIDRFRSFHAGQRPPTLAELKPAFELLLMKVLSLLQDHDKALANDINASRDAIWGVLADRDKLSQFVQ